MTSQDKISNALAQAMHDGIPEVEDLIQRYANYIDYGSCFPAESKLTEFSGELWAIFVEQLTRELSEG